MARILIAGCGDVGTALGLRLGAAGHTVWGLRRRPESLPAPIRPFAADLTEPSSLASLPTDLDAVVFAASAPARTDDAYRATYVNGLSNLGRALRDGKHDLDRFLFTSSTGVYPENDGGWVDESSATASGDAHSFTGRRMIEAESLVDAFPWPSVSVRFGGIYGPGRNRLISRARQLSPSDTLEDRYTNRIHVDDCAGVLAHLLTLEHPESTYVAVDHAPVRLSEVIAFLRARLGLPPLPEAAETPRRGKRCRNERLRASGYDFSFPSYREGYASIDGR